MHLTSEPIEHGYSIIRMITDELSGSSVPLGVVVWNAEISWYGIRVLASDEGVSGFQQAHRVLLNIALDQIEGWTSRREVPYARRELDPSSGPFWTAVSKVMKTGIQLDLPRAIDPFTDLDSGLESLFEAVVSPKHTPAASRRRIDGAVSKALGEYADRLDSKVEVDAYGGMKERVLRGMVSTSAALFVDGVNLSTATARPDADALVSKLRRIRNAHEDRHSEVVVGYISSPGGLNGEGPMRDWIREELTSHVYDLDLEGETLRKVVANELRRFEERFPPS